MRIALAADHAGFELKDALGDWLREAGHEVTDLGTNSAESVDYPEFGTKLAAEVASGRVERGIAVCGSGIGISIAVNRNPKCRCHGSTIPCRQGWHASIMTPMCLRSAVA